MSKAVYVGVGNSAKKCKKIYVGVNGIAKEVKKGYIGVNGVAKEFYSSGSPIWPEYVVSKSGRKFGRHPTLPGTVMQWDDNGTTRYTLILDAAYRTMAVLYSDSKTDLGLTTHTSYGNSISKLATDDTLNADSNANQDQSSSTVRTNEWWNCKINDDYIIQNDTNGAVYYVRNTLTDTSTYPELLGQACDLPTINCLCRIYADSAILDSLDPTSSWSEYTLANWWSYSGYYAAWSSSWHGNYAMSYCGLGVYFNGDVYNFYKQSSTYGVIPVLELLPIPTTIAEEKTYFAEVGESGYTWTTITEAEGGSGRSFARCKCEQGTIMKWNDNGTTRHTIILDAAYRASYKALYSDNSINLGLTSHTNTGWFSPTGSETSLPAIPANFTDSALNNKSMANQDTRSSTVATNEWANSSYYGTDMAAVYYVRNTLVTTTGVMMGCDLPTINCLTRIYGDMTILDSMDPTISSSPGSSFKLSSWSFRSGTAWSSSWYGNYVSGTYAGLVLNKTGMVNICRQLGTEGVLPVLEL